MGKLDRILKTSAGIVKDPRKKELTDKDLRERLELSRQARRKFEYDWWLNLAYINNEQYVDFDVANGRLKQLDDHDGLRTVNNQMMKIQRIERAKILRTLPIPKALPAREDQEAYEQARIMTAWFDQVRHEVNYEDKLRRLSYWVTGTGNGFLHWGFEGKKHPTLTVHSPFEVFPDPHARDFHSQRWCIVENFVSEEDAWDMYGDNKDANPENLVCGSTETLNPLEHRVLTDVGLGETNLEGVTLYRYYEPPRPKTGFAGRYIVFTRAGIVLEMDEYPYAHNMIPLTHVGHIVRSSSKYYASVMDSERTMQDELNRCENQIIENRNLANGIWMIPAEVEMDQPITAEPRQVITWKGNPIDNPQNWFVTPPAMANWVKDEPQRYAASMSDVASQHEVSNAGVPGRVDAAQAIQLLQESDDSVLKDTILSLEEAIERGFNMMMYYAKHHAEGDLLVQAYDPDSRVLVESLQRDTIDVAMRVEVQTTTALPQSIAGKWDRVMTLVQNELIEPQQALRLLDLSVAEPSLDPDHQDRQRAYIECKQIAKASFDVAEDGTPIPKGDVPKPPEPWRNHAVELEVKNMFRNSVEYQRLPEPNKAYLNFICSVHEEVVAMQQQPEPEPGSEQQAPPGPM